MLQQRKRKWATEAAMEGPQPGRRDAAVGVGEGKANVWSTDVAASVAAAKVQK